MNRRGMREELDALAVDSRLRALATSPLQAFNVFEALGEVRRELTHSAFLAFLLDPRESHGLDDTFVSLLLDRSESPFGGPHDENVWTVEREVPFVDLITQERGRIDILALDHAYRRAIIIENKVDTSEHNNQLLRYYEDIRRRYPGWDTRGIYLTPHGDKPSCNHYVPMSYRYVCTAIDDAIASRGDGIDDDVRATLRQYTAMVKRHIVDESGIDRECQRIYLEHGKAIAKVQERVKAMQKAISRELEAMVQAQRLVSGDRFAVKQGWWDPGQAQLITFIPEGWRSIDKLRRVAPSRNGDAAFILDFQIFNWPQGVDLMLKIVPGLRDMRQSIIELVGQQRQPDGPFDLLDSPSQDYVRIYSRPLVAATRYATSDYDELVADIHNQWAAFIAHDLPRIDGALRQWSNSATN